MRRYYFGNRRRLQHLAGPAIDVGDTYVMQVSVGSKSTTPVDASLRPFGPLYGGDEPTVAKDVDVHGTQMQVDGLRAPGTHIPIGRERPVKVAICGFSSEPFRSEWPNLQQYDQQPFADNFNVRVKEQCNALIAFLENTPSGFGKRYLKFYLRQIRQVQVSSNPATWGPPPVPFSTEFPLEGSNSFAPVGDTRNSFAPVGDTRNYGAIVELLTVSEVNDGSESVLSHRLVPTGAQLKIALAKRGEGSATKLFVNIYGRDAWLTNYFDSGAGVIDTSLLQQRYPGWPNAFVWSDTVEINWTPQSKDATIFGVSRKNSLVPIGLPSQFSGLQDKDDESPDATALPVHDICHDSVTHAPFVAGMRSIPDVDAQNIFSSRRSAYEKSELSDRFVCKTVRSFPGVSAKAPDEEGDSTRICPLPTVGGSPERFLAEYYPDRRGVVERTTLECAGHLTMCDAEARFAALPPGEAFCCGGKEITSVTVTLTTQTGYVHGQPWPPEWQNPTGGEEPYLPVPHGDFQCTPWSIGPAGGRSIYRCESEFRNAMHPFGNTESMMTIRSHAEIFVILYTSLMGAGEYGAGSDPEGATDVQKALNRIIRPDAPKGDISLMHYHTPALPPSPLIAARVIFRGVSMTGYNPPRPSWYAPLTELGFTRQTVRGSQFLAFTKDQSKNLAKGSKVRATRWAEKKPNEDFEFLRMLYGTPGAEIKTSTVVDLQLNQ